MRPCRVDLQFHVDHVPAQRVVIFVGVRGMVAVPAMIRILVVVEDMILVHILFVVEWHSQAAEEVDDSSTYVGVSVRVAGRVDNRPHAPGITAFARACCRKSPAAAADHGSPRRNRRASAG